MYYILKLKYSLIYFHTNVCAVWKLYNTNFKGVVFLYSALTNWTHQVCKQISCKRITIFVAEKNPMKWKQIEIKMGHFMTHWFELIFDWLLKNMVWVQPHSQTHTAAPLPSEFSSHLQCYARAFAINRLRTISLADFNYPRAACA